MSEWINAKNILPEDLLSNKEIGTRKQIKLILTDGKRVFAGSRERRYTDTPWFWNRNSNITHWQFLPSPPNTDGKRNEESKIQLQEYLHKRLTILVDMDDVLDELLKHWILELNKKSQTNVKQEDIISWDIHPYFPSLLESQIYAPLKEDSFWENMTAVNEARIYIEKLQNDGHRVFVVTATHYSTVKPKIKWLLNTFPSLTWEDIVITSHKYLIKGDMLIDDGIHNLVVFNGERILFDRPHNHSFDENKIGAIRVKDWKETYEVVNKYAQYKEVV